MKKHTLIILALALFASVFVCTAFTADAEQCGPTVEPWAVVASIRYNGDSYLYDYRQHLDADSGSAYLGRIGKLRLYERLVALSLDENAVYNYIFPDFDCVVDHFLYAERTVTDATAELVNDVFRYKAGQNGIEIDRKALFLAMTAQCGRACVIDLPIIEHNAVMVEQLKGVTVLRGSFTTSFANSRAERCHNIRLAASKLDGLCVPAGGTFSFNGVVGERTEQNGYKNAAVIADGKYTDGVGGGVCQVSTTLYNALLLADFVPRAFRHSLVPSYVEAGFDAMVAYGTTDLSFINNTSSAVYVSARVEGRSITFKVYGAPNAYRIERESVSERQPFDTVYEPSTDPDIVYDDQFKVVRNGSDGVTSKAYLLKYNGDRLVERRLLRIDEYKRVDKLVIRGTLPRPSE